MSAFFSRVYAMNDLNTFIYSTMISNLDHASQFDNSVLINPVKTKVRLGNHV